MDSNLIRNKEAKKIVNKIIKNSKIFDLIDLRNYNAYFKLSDDILTKADFIVATDCFIYILVENNNKSLFDRKDYHCKAFFLSDIAVDKQGRLLVFYSKEMNEKRISFYIDFIKEELTMYFDYTTSSEEQLKLFLENLYIAISKRMIVKIKKEDE